MKKYFLQAMLLFASIAAFAQDQEEHSSAYSWGERNTVPILIGVAVVIILVIVWVRSRKKKSS